MPRETALKLASRLHQKEISVTDVVQTYLEKAKQNRHNAFIHVSEEYALTRASDIQKQIDAGAPPSPLAGVPVAIKDNISVKDMPATCASKILENYKPVFNAAVIDRLEKAGLIIIGKLNMDEFAMGGSSETGAFGPVLNPWDKTRVAGGSSGGSAAAVVSGEVPLALGSDTGGSIRQPCAFCAATGIKPTYGAVSRYGGIAYASSHDQIGPIAGNIDDCAALLSIISGPDKRDSTCIIDKPFDFFDTHSNGSENLSGVKIGLPRNYLGDGLDGDVKSAVTAAAKVLEETGASVEEFDMPLMDYIVPAYYIIACAEASSNLAKYDGLKYGYRSSEAKTLQEVYRLSRSEAFGMEVKRRIMLGSFVLSSGYYDAYYKKALKIRTLIKNAYNDLFKRFDIILSPVATTTAYKIGENINDPIKMYMGDIYTASINLAGIPAAAIPCGFDNRGLPVGMQLIGDTFSEEKLIKAARVYQNHTDYHNSQPAVSQE